MSKVYKDTVGKPDNNTCKKWRPRQRGIHALASFTLLGCTTSDGETQLTKQQTEAIRRSARASALSHLLIGYCPIKVVTETEIDGIDSGEFA